MSLSLSRTLPASWYTSDKIVDLAHDHIFDKGWLFVTPIASFVRGHLDASQFDFNGRPFFVINDIEDVYQCHDVCAYYGNYSEMMAGLSIEQVYSKIASVEKVRSYTHPSGLFFVCHDKKNAPSWEDFYGKNLQQILKMHDFRKLQVRRRISYDCKFNFITFIDGYQECLHCTYTHPGLKATLPLDVYKIENLGNFSRHYCFDEKTGNEMNGVFLYFFPTSSLNFYQGGMSCFRVRPIDGNNSRMEFEYFFSGTDEEFEKYYKFARQVATEDQDLCEACQRNLQVGMYRGGILNPSKENGVIHYQSLIRNRILAGVRGLLFW